MKTSQKGFIAPRILALIAVLLLGGGAYVYMQNKQVNQSATVTPTTQVVQTTVVGPVFNNVRIRDNATFLFTDNNNKTWTVNYQNTNFSEYSATTGNIQGTNGLLKTTLQEWLKTQKHVGDPDDQSGAPGSIAITGTLNTDVVLVASSIRINGQ